MFLLKLGSWLQSLIEKLHELQKLELRMDSTSWNSAEESTQIFF